MAGSLLSPALDGVVHLQFKLFASNLKCNKWLYHPNPLLI